MDEIELDKETYEKVVSLIQSGKKAKALKAILPEANEDSKLAETVLAAIEKSLKRRSRSSSDKDSKSKLDPEKKKDKKDKKDKKKDSSSAEPDSPAGTIIELPPSEVVPRRKRKGKLLGDHKGISGIELEKETFLEVVELIKSGKREQALDLIFEDSTQSKALANQVLEAIERTLPKKPGVGAKPSASGAPVSAVLKKERPKPDEKKKQAPLTKTSSEIVLPPEDDIDPFAQENKELRRTTLLVILLSGILGYWFYRSGVRPLKAILMNLGICLIAGLVVMLFSSSIFSGGKLPGSDPADRDTLNFVAVAMCPLLATDLDLNSSQRSFCERKRKRFAYYLYEESQKIDGSETIRGPFSEETLQAGLYILGKEIKGQLNRGQRKQFLKLYENKGWRQVDIIDEDGRLRLEYPKYGNVPGVISLSVASQK